MKTIRCFIAVKLDIDTVRALAETQKQLKDRCNEAGIDVSWVPPPNMHVTIRFLGQITEPMAHALRNMIEPITSKTKPFELEAAALGAFPDTKRPRVVWAGLQNGKEELTELHGEVSKRLIGAGFHLDDKPFSSHITIGRVKGGSIDGFESCLGDDDQFFGTTWVRNLYCYRSDLTTKGAEYHVIWRLPLTGGGYRARHSRPTTDKTSHEGSKGDGPNDDSTG
ncbi:MAG: RNA 2',3'-cyclic phosphodiesterase [Proteobacteria bacterium]|nr:RNA 2',3'-cyclic phosphodiesterase [Pseudomonadota bacterium]